MNFGIGIIYVKNSDETQLIPNITDQEIKYLESQFGPNIKYGFTHLKEHQEMDGIAYGTMMQNGDEIILSKEGWAYLAGNTKQTLEIMWKQIVQLRTVDVEVLSHVDYTYKSTIQSRSHSSDIASEETMPSISVMTMMQDIKQYLKDEGKSSKIRDWIAISVAIILGIFSIVYTVIVPVCKFD